MEGAREALERLLEVVQIMVTEASKALHRESVNGEAVREKKVGLLYKIYWQEPTWAHMMFGTSKVLEKTGLPDRWNVTLGQHKCSNSWT